MVCAMKPFDEKFFLILLIIETIPTVGPMNEVTSPKKDWILDKSRPGN